MLADLAATAHLVWSASPGLLSLILGLSIVLALVPAASLWVGKLLLDEVARAISGGFSSAADAYRRLASLLTDRIALGGAFRGVAEITSGVRGELLLRTHLDEIYHDAVSPPGSARVTLTAELSDPAGRNLVARRSFSASLPVSSYDAAGAVRGSGQVLGELLDEIAVWAAEAATAQVRQVPTMAGHD